MTILQALPTMFFVHVHDPFPFLHVTYSVTREPERMPENTAIDARHVLLSGDQPPCESRHRSREAILPPPTVLRRAGESVEGRAWPSSTSNASVDGRAAQGEWPPVRQRRGTRRCLEPFRERCGRLAC